MPLRDGTGPLGKGPRTGRGLGNCPGTSQSKNRNLGRKIGRGVKQGRRAK